MLYEPMLGVRVLELAQFTFVPAACGVLADWGAQVIKIEHAEAGDAQRGLQAGTGAVKAGTFQPLMEGPNRGKRSIGLSLDTEAGKEVFLELVRNSDVFVTNFLPGARTRLGIEVDDLRATNSNIIYVRGSAHGPRGDEAERGGYDGSTFWARMGPAQGVTPSDSPRMIGMPAGAFGDNIGGMTMAGGIAAALFARERTGEPAVVDVSLMSVGAWAMSLSLNNALLTDQAPPQLPLAMSKALVPNPLVGGFRTSDGRWLYLTVLQAGRYWADTCRHLGLEHLIDDERFNTAEKLMENATEARELVRHAFSGRAFDEWLRRLSTMKGQWAPMQDALEVVNDPQVRVNGYISPVTDQEGNQRELVASPVQFNEQPPNITRAPQFAEHTDEILLELGRSYDEVLQLKLDNVIT